LRAVLVFVLGKVVCDGWPEPMIGAVLQASRPKTLPAAVVPVWVGCVLAWRLGFGFDGLLAACTLGGALAIQVATNLFNDAIDAAKGADTVRRLGPQRVTASGRMARRAVLVWAGTFLLLAVGCGLVLFDARGWPIVAIGLPSIYLAYGYTGGPFPLAYRGMGEVFVILFFGVVAVAGTVFVQSGRWPAEAFLLGVQVGLLSAVLISINNLRDRDEDAGTGKRTLAVRLGPRAARILVWLEVKLAALLGLAWFLFGDPLLGLATAPVWLLGGRLGFAVLTQADGRELNRWLAVGGVQLLLFAVAFHLVAWLV
jgi:1,4-dihydroxy-2-naphthoate octaprenyltransferase